MTPLLSSPIPSHSIHIPKTLKTQYKKGIGFDVLITALVLFIIAGDLVPVTT